MVHVSYHSKRVLTSSRPLELMEAAFSLCTKWARWKGKKQLLFTPMMSSGADLFYYRGLNNSTSAVWLSPNHVLLLISPPSLSLQLQPGLMPTVCLTAAYTPLSGSADPLIHANLLLEKCRCLNNLEISYHMQAKCNQYSGQGLPKAADSLK